MVTHRNPFLQQVRHIRLAPVVRSDAQHEAKVGADEEVEGFVALGELLCHGLGGEEGGPLVLRETLQQAPAHVVDNIMASSGCPSSRDSRVR